MGEPSLETLAGQIRELATLFETKLIGTREDIVDLKSRIEANAHLQREQWKEFVLLREYEADKRTATAQREATDQRLTHLESQHEAHKAHTEAQYESHRQELASHHRQNRVLFWTVAAAILGAIATVVTSVLTVKGGH